MLGTKHLDQKKSKYNGKLTVVKTLGIGTYIQSDGLTQSGGIVEAFWKQTIKHLKRDHKNIRKVLVLGLGGGTLIKHIKKEWKDAKITAVDIDKVIVDLGKKYLSLKESDADIFITDAQKFMDSPKFNKNKYDLIIVDLYNGDKFPEKFAKLHFFEKARLGLVKNGVIIFNRLYYKDKKALALEFGEKLKKVFAKVEYYFPVTNLMLICKI